MTALSPGLQLTVYGIVQEAMTNTVKHAAAPSRVSVDIAVTAGGVDVEVTDDGGAAPVPADPGGAGHGLVGMRERAAVYLGPGLSALRPPRALRGRGGGGRPAGGA